MKSAIVTLVVLAALAATWAGPAPAVPAQRKLKPLAEVLKDDPSPAAKDSVKDSIVVAAAAVDSRKLGCYEPGCNFQCQQYRYAGGYCRWGECLCWYY